MKRKSARPFTVEVKHARGARTAPATSFAQVRTGGDLWHDLIGHELARHELAAQDFTAVEADGGPRASRPKPPVRLGPAREETPARRILPNLAPTLMELDEPEVPAEPAPPRGRRPRAAGGTVARTSPPAAISATPAVIRPAAERPTRETVPAPKTVEPAPLPSVAKLPRRAEGRPGRVRAGERWKRRLPRALR